MDRDDLKTLLIILAIASVGSIAAFGLSLWLRKTGPQRSVPLAVIQGDRSVFDAGELRVTYEPVFPFPARGSSGRPYGATLPRPEYAAPVLDKWAEEARASVRVATAAQIYIEDRMVAMGQLGIIDGLESIAPPGDRYGVVYKARFEGVKEAVEIPVTSWRTIVLILSPAGRPELALWIAENPAEADRALRPFAENKRLFEHGGYSVSSYRYFVSQGAVDRAFGDFYLLSSHTARPNVGIGVIYPEFRRSEGAALARRILSTLSASVGRIPRHGAR